MLRYNPLNNEHKYVQVFSGNREYSVLIEYYNECHDSYTEPRGKEELEDMDRVLYLFEGQREFDILNAIATFIEIYVRFHKATSGISLDCNEVYEEAMSKIIKSEEEK